MSRRRPDVRWLDNGRRRDTGRDDASAPESNNNLTDIRADFTRDEETIEGTKHLPVEDLPPVIERTADDRYATVIFVDEGINPPGELRVSLRLTAGGGLFHRMGQDTYRTEMSEDVPAGADGRIVVNATVEKRRSSRP
ncbi:hypothetical protein [Methanoculleus bourgensis]|uniref:hypothetical protein n=1 Tax=Methanoculleus bourgensis TaxID=83986 RepID=UPI0022EDE4D6|nr:hypothetical protein [Methanoculleus bourgensis]GLI45834.1 hypothetical protein MBOURGENBZM_06260 [Methanoculleus bourgensis]